MPSSTVTNVPKARPQACGRHLAWGYPDQPPLVPLIARAMSAIGPGSLTLLRTPSAISAGLVVVLAALTAR
jgi:hypothetical protein